MKFRVTDPDSGKTLVLTGDSPPTEEELEEIFASAGQPQVVAGSNVEPSMVDSALLATSVLPGSPAGVIDAGLSVGSAVANQVVGGLGGMVTTAVDGAESGAKFVEAAQGNTRGPATQAGAQTLETLGDLVNFGVDVAQVPISGIAGLMEILNGLDEPDRGLSQAAETIKDVQENGAGVTFGDRVLEETGSPELATLARVAPEGAAELLALKGGGSIARRGMNVKPFRYTTPTKRRIAAKLANRTGDTEIARYRLVEQGKASIPEDGIRVPAPKSNTGLLSRYLDDGGPRVVKDPAAIEAIRQGFDEGVVAPVKVASPRDKKSMLRMVDVMERGKNNKQFALTHRPTDVVGDTLLSRFKEVSRVNREARSQLDSVAKGLKGQHVDYSDSIVKFLDDLDELGVRFDDKLNPVFGSSQIQGVTTAENAIRNIVKRMRDIDTPDAFDVHSLKRFIDEQVSFGGGTQKGLTGRTETILKRLRHNLDETLDLKFPEYNRVNSTYAETRQAIDAMQDAAGKKLNLSGKNADKATGTLMRRLMSNAQSRVNLLDAITEVERVAKKTKRFDDDILTQVLFADELDSVFGPVARTSFQGQIGQAVEGVADVASDPTSFRSIAKNLGMVVDRSRGVTDPARFKAIRELLSSP